MAVSFGDFAFDQERRQLLRLGEPVPLETKAYELLDLLLSRRPTALSKAQIRAVLWPGTFVSESALARLVTQLRAACGDDAQNPRFIRTVHGFGYAFCGEARPLSGSAVPAPATGSRFGIVWQSRELPLVPGESLIGRDPECAVRIDRPLISRRHARIRIDGDGATIEDLGSKNGTSLGGKRVLRPTDLADGAEIVVGSEVLVFRDSGPLHSTRTGPASRK